ncbi:hypothetical protein BU24DRAFT_420642 [Aaosphaeria arxii CBS 175.79]|uniref:Uncharacterized protein n=1 Tax=Aaosphaeria arxii CBS 175.79 TaxID=1450172 RepID=A0A6A5XZA9_9PLEO|nr:uncharacterized protein BU24DRAFT_420642 [Aaosphaeria arxii CBS 175.79]KAF2017604.1 hypothetical protein BU24DRAFT_420642 [Aaosphaeria arxii CBS 175.79]
MSRLLRLDAKAAEVQALAGYDDDQWRWFQARSLHNGIFQANDMHRSLHSPKQKNIKKDFQ